MPIPSSTAAQATVALRACFKPAPCMKSTTQVEAIAFSAALRLAMAAARIAATESPARPGGSSCHRKAGYIRSICAGAAMPESP